MYIYIYIYIHYIKQQYDCNYNQQNISIKKYKKIKTRLSGDTITKLNKSLPVGLGIVPEFTYYDGCYTLIR